MFTNTMNVPRRPIEDLLDLVDPAEFEDTQKRREIEESVANCLTHLAAGEGYLHHPVQLRQSTDEQPALNAILNIFTASNETHINLRLMSGSSMPGPLSSETFVFDPHHPQRVTLLEPEGSITSISAQDIERGDVTYYVGAQALLETWQDYIKEEVAAS